MKGERITDPIGADNKETFLTVETWPKAIPLE
jgi:hypothetical protein